MPDSVSKENWQRVMRKEKLIDSLQHTLEFASNHFLDRINMARNTGRVYHEGFVSDKVREKSENCEIIVEASTSFVSVKSYLQYGKVAVLNFANPQIAGGGGNMVQWNRKNVFAEAAHCIHACLMSIFTRNIISTTETDADTFFRIV